MRRREEGRQHGARGAAKRTNPRRARPRSTSDTVDVLAYVKLLRWVTSVLDAHDNNVRELQKHLKILQEMREANDVAAARHHILAQIENRPASRTVFELRSPLKKDGLDRVVELLEMHLEKARQQQAEFIESLAPKGRRRDLFTVFGFHLGMPQKEVRELSAMAISVVGELHARFLPENDANALVHRDIYIAGAVRELKAFMTEQNRVDLRDAAAESVYRARSSARGMKTNRVAELLDGLNASKRPAASFDGIKIWEEHRMSVEKEIAKLSERLTAIDPLERQLREEAKTQGKSFSRHLVAVHIVADLCGVSPGLVHLALKKENADELKLIKDTGIPKTD